MTLYHYTNAAGARAIVDNRGLVPLERHGDLTFVWLTDVSVPWPRALGLPEDHNVRFVIPNDELVDVLPWPVQVGRLKKGELMAAYNLELQDGVRPDRWFVGTKPVHGVAA